MRSQVLGLKVAGAVFGLMSLAQLCRLVIRPEIVVAGHHMPLWPSTVAFFIFGALSIWLLRLALTRV